MEPMDLSEKLAAAKSTVLEKVGFKKGEPFRWRDVDRLEVQNRHPGWWYRWIVNEPSSIEKRESQGYVIVNSMTGIPGDVNPVTPESKDVSGGKRLRELVLTAQPEELRKARYDYLQERADKQTAGLKEKLSEGLASIPSKSGKPHGGTADGKIIIG